MKLSYASLKDDDVFILTDFTCEPSQDLLKESGMFKILWSQGGPVNLTMDGYEITLDQHEVIFCTPLNVLDIPMDNKGLVAYVFNKEFFCIQTHDDKVSCQGFLFFGSSEPPIIHLDEQGREQFENLQHLFQEDFQVDDHLRGEMLRSLLKRMLILSTRMAKTALLEPGISNTQVDIIRSYNLLVEKHFREYHQVKEYANLLFKSPKTLSNIFSKYSNKSPINFIHERIILEARRLLLYSNKSTDLIARELGYSDASHFSKFFKKHVGKSPSALRKEHALSTS